jgi:hypothetical protein
MNIPNVFAGDAFNIDANLSKTQSIFKTNDTDMWYEFPDNYQFDLSNSTLVCPSNECKTILDVSSILVSDMVMGIHGSLTLVDDKTNGHFDPKKQNLIESMGFSFSCKYQDIQEDPVKKTTKYICSELDNGSITRTYNDTTYPYKFTATFELPSKHLVLNATEAHENPYLLFSGHLVYIDENGKEQVK